MNQMKTTSLVSYVHYADVSTWKILGKKHLWYQWAAPGFCCAGATWGQSQRHGGRNSSHMSLASSYLGETGGGNL